MFLVQKRGSAAGVGFLFVLLILLGASLYLLYLNWPSDPIEYVSVQTGEGETLGVHSQSKQFYENMRFPNDLISYHIETACDDKKIGETEEAFRILEEETVLTFYPDETDPDITIYCSDIAPESEKSGYFVAGEGGPTEVLNTSLYGVILSGKISYFRKETCKTPHIALHELLHVLGFDHNENPGSIMFPTLDCKQTLDDSIIEDINLLYSVDGAPDVTIEMVDANKTGRYLSFSIEVVNQGLLPAETVPLAVYAGTERVKEFDLETVGVGTTKILEVENLKISRSSKDILFIVDERNEIEEIFENNNQLALTLAE